MRSPSFTVVAVTTLALGFGAAAALISLTHATLYRTLPFDATERLAVLWRQTEHLERSSLSYLNFVDWRDRNRSFEAMAALIGDTRSFVDSEGQAHRLPSLLVSYDLLETLGLEPIAGRAFDAGDDRVGAAPTAMISARLWRERFGEDPGLLGTALRLDDREHTVIGVLPPGVAGRTIGATELGDVWIPWSLSFDELPIHERASRIGIVPIARLREGVDLEQARADLERVAAELETEYPLSNRTNQARLAPLVEDMVGSLRPLFATLGLMVGFVILIACTNLAGLFLTRLMARSGELAVRRALGAGRWRVLRVALSESALMATGGAVAGVGVALLLLRALPALARDLPPVETPHLITALAAVFVFGGIATLAIALGPMLVVGAVSHPLSGHRATVGRAHTRARHALVAAELAVAVVLVVGSLLATVSLRNLRHQDLGVDPSSVATALTTLPTPRYADTEPWTAFFDRLLADAREIPGIEQVALSSRIPLVDIGGGSRVLAGDRPVPSVPEMEVTDWITVSTETFAALRIPLLEGRTFDQHDDDRQNRPKVAVISETLAELFWPGRSALGQRIAFELDGTPADFEPIWREVVGVVGDVRYDGPRSEPGNVVYVPYTQRPLWDLGQSPPMAIVLRGDVDPDVATASLREIVRSIDPRQPIYDAVPLKDRLAAHLGSSRLLSWLLGGFAALALVLAVVGVYGLVSAAVQNRRLELGIRAALGARPAANLYRVVTAIVWPVLAGGILGLGLTAASTRLLGAELFEVAPLQPGLLALAVGGLVASSLLAAVLGALSVLRLHGKGALRSEGEIAG